MAKEVTRLRVGAKTDPGLKRELNEDDFIVVEMFKDRENLAVAEKKGNVYIVADGVGGHNAGEVASRMTVDIVSQRYYEDESPNIRESLDQAVQSANSQIFERAQSVRSETGMGSTVVAAVIRGHELHLIHAGDSRAYLVRGGRIHQLTKDHSWVSEQIAHHRITPEEARTHPYRSYITRSLGTKPEMEPEYTSPLTIHRGDVIVLCTDGLSGQVDDQTILEIVSRAEPADACDELVRLANEAGGPDNITAVVVQVEQVVSTLPKYGVEVPTQVPKGKPTRERQNRQQRKRRRWVPATRIIVIFLLLATAICACALLAVLVSKGESLLQERDQEIHQIGGTATALVMQLSPAPPEIPASEASFAPTPRATEKAGAVAQIFTETATATSLPTDGSMSTSISSSTAMAPQVAVSSSADTATYTPSPTPGPWLRVLAGALNARGGPQMSDDAILGQFYRGDTLPVIGRSRYGTWLKVCCWGPDEMEVWVSSRADLVEVSVEIRTLPVVR